MTPEDIKTTARRSSRTTLVPKRLNYSPESSAPAKKTVKSELQHEIKLTLPDIFVILSLHAPMLLAENHDAK